MSKIEDLTDSNAEIVLSNIISSMPGHVYWKNTNGVYLGCNDKQAQSLGFNKSTDIVGKNDFDLPWGKGMAEKFRENDSRIIKSGVPEITEEPSVVEGKKVIVLSQKTPLKDKRGNIYGILGISIDITELKETQAALEKAKERAEIGERTKTEFIANVSHDIRTPLAGLIGSRICWKRMYLRRNVKTLRPNWRPLAMPYLKCLLKF